MHRKSNSKLKKQKSGRPAILLLAVAALILTSFPAGAVRAYESPGKPAGFVNDFAGIISETDRQAMEGKLTGLRQATGVEVAVVTVKSLGDETVETFATRLFEEWEIGDREIDNGLLVLVAPNEREVRIEVGYGLEGAVTDLQSGNIIRNVFIPAFKNGDYSGGISAGVDAILSIINKAPGSEIYSTPPQQEKESFNFGSLAFMIIVLLNVVLRMLGRTKSWWLGGVLGAAAGGIIGLIFGFIMTGIISVVLLTILGLVLDYFMSKHFNRPGGPHPWWIGGPGAGGKSSGGFGGFGGGMSGGGGASGRW